jgi:hypothetical protein
MERMATISPSQLRAMECRQQWAWAYRDGYKANRMGDALELGIGIHEALEVYYKGEEDDPAGYFEKWFGIRGIDSEKMLKLGKAMLEGYVDHWYGKDEFDVLGTEKTIFRPLPVPYTDQVAECSVVVRLDMLVRCHRTGKLFSLDHKTFSRFNSKDIENDQQFTAQIWVGETLTDGEPIVGVIYNGLRKQTPGPRVKLNLFERRKTFRNQAQIDAFLLRAYFQYRDAKTWEIFPQPGSIKCNMCDFQAPCSEKQRGGDYEYLLQENYTKRGEK